MSLFIDNQKGLLKTQAQRRRRGQTAIIALLVLLLLSFVGALFITIVANNLRAQGRAHRTLNADYYAQAGLRYADDQLTHSLDGADWRPPLQNALAPAAVTQLIGPANSRAYNEYVAYGQANPGFQLPSRNDPDYNYLVQGFTRYNTEGGRFLLRVSYAPAQSTTSDPSARYLKIEAVGRQGTINPTDPTTFTNQPPTQLAATLVAYKPIGITDYARFETNLNNRSGIMNLGVPSENPNQVPNGIITPGIDDFNMQSANTLNSQQPIAPYPIITTYGQPDAYMANAQGQIFANPLAGQGTVTNGTYTGVAPTGYTPVAGGGSIRANGSVRFYGESVDYLNRNTASTTYNVLDDIEVAGNLLLDSYNPTIDTYSPQSAPQNQNSGLAVQNAALILNPASPMGPTPDPTQGQAANAYVGPSQAPSRPFSTFGGAVRDGGTGSNANDAAGYPRSVARLDPPVIDTVNSGTSLTRYQDITENSPERLVLGMNGGVASDGPANPADPNAGQDGWGQAIYVNNFSDAQHESNSLVGGHTLIDEWLNKGSGGQPAINAKGGWDGPFYNPPGVDISFGLQQEIISGNPKPVSFYGIRLTRSDVDRNGNPVLWHNPDGSAGSSPTMIVSYHDLYASHDPDNLTGNQTNNQPNSINPSNDVVIYCEGNVRIKPSLISAFASETTVPAGEPSRLYPANSGGTDTSDDRLPRHITIVTNGTAYIEGSILKGNPDSSMTILAKNYICINTTQFYAGAIADENPYSTQPPSASVADNALLDFGAQNDLLVQDFILPNVTINGNAALYLSGGPSAPGITTADYDLVNPTTGLNLNNSSPFTNPSLTPITFNSADAPGLVTTTSGTLGIFGPTSLAHATDPLTYAFTRGNIQPGQPLQLWTRLDPNTTPIAPGVNVGTQDYMQQRSAILPMDVTIQAVLYAQDKSFFVIPGPWFNSDTGDNLTSFASELQNNDNPPLRPGVDTTNRQSSRFPFYGQPVDLKITVDGAVSENVPAPITAQAEWMARWGWIPQFHGSNVGVTTPAEPSGHPSTTPNQPGAGLTLVYDPEAGYPFDPTGQGALAANNSSNMGYYLRTDIYGRPLPFSPKLPVSTGLLYSGQGNPQSLVQ